MHIVLSGHLVVTVASTQAAVGKSLFSGGEGPAAVTKHGLGTVLGYGLLLTGTPEEYYCPRGRRSAPLQITAGCAVTLLQIPQGFTDVVMRRNPLGSTVLAARQVCSTGAFGGHANLLSTTLDHVTTRAESIVPTVMQLLETIPRVLRVVDVGVQWRQLSTGWPSPYGLKPAHDSSHSCSIHCICAGGVLVEEGAPSHGCVYVLLYGRVRLSMRGETEGKVKILSDHGRGTLIGEGELLTGGAYKVRQLWP